MSFSRDESERLCAHIEVLSGSFVVDPALIQLSVMFHGDAKLTTFSQLQVEVSKGALTRGAGASLCTATVDAVII